MLLHERGARSRIESEIKAARTLYDMENVVPNMMKKTTQSVTAQNPGNLSMLARTRLPTLTVLTLNDCGAQVSQLFFIIESIVGEGTGCIIFIIRHFATPFVIGTSK